MARHGRRVRRGNRQRFIIIFSIFCVMFIMVSGYAAFSTKLSIGAVGNVVDRSRTIKSWNGLPQEDFHTDFYRENIVSATFLDSAKVPENAKESWDVSVDKDKGVMAYVVENSSETGKYDLFIGAKDGVIANEDSSSLFYKFSGLKSIEFNDNFDTSNVVKMLHMFMDCHELTSLDLSSFDTRNVTTMGNMFVSSSSTNPMKLETIIFGEKFITSNVTNMWAMFGNCSHLVNLDVSGFDTSNVVEMTNMFYNCLKLTNIDVNKWDTSNVTSMQAMFYNCGSLTILDLCSWNTKKVTDMSSMFTADSRLTEIKVGPNWTTANVTDSVNMFGGSGVSSVTSGKC